MRILVLRLVAVILLLGCPQIGSAAGRWSVLSLSQKPGEVRAPRAMAVDAAGNLYVVDYGDGAGRIEKRDVQGSWSIFDAPGATALALDTKGNL
jgi:hypothetical protein